MAIAVVNKKQTAGGVATATLKELTAATAGNILVVFIAQSSTTSTPTGKDNISGTTGWTVNATSAVGNTSGNSLFVATKTAVGGETELNPTVGAGGTIQGLSYFELSGATATVDTIVATNNPGSVATVTSASVTTTEAGDIVLGGVGFQNAASGTVTAWTGTGPMTNTETATTRCIGGSYIPGSTVSGVTFTANWTTARQVEMLVVALKPAAVAEGNTVSMLL